MQIALEPDYLYKIRVRHGNGSTLVSHGVPIIKIESDDFVIDFQQIMKEIFRRECLREFCNAEYYRTGNEDLLSHIKQGYIIDTWQVFLVVINGCPIVDVLSSKDKIYWSGLNCKKIKNLELINSSADTIAECEWASRIENN